MSSVWLSGVLRSNSAAYQLTLQIAYVAVQPNHHWKVIYFGVVAIKLLMYMSGLIKINSGVTKNVVFLRMCHSSIALAVLRADWWNLWNLDRNVAVQKILPPFLSPVAHVYDKMLEARWLYSSTFPKLPLLQNHQGDVHAIIKRSNRRWQESGPSMASAAIFVYAVVWLSGLPD